MYTFKTLQGLFSHIEQNIDNDNYLNYLEDGIWLKYSSSLFISNVKRLAYGLREHGVKKGTCVAILTPSSPQWLMFDYALQLLGAISVPIFSNVSTKNLNYELKNADIKHIFLLEEDKSKILENSEFDIEFTLTLQELHNFLSKYYELTDIEDIYEDDIATIIYTSGSTGVPKGVELSHKNIVTNIYDTAKKFPVGSSDVALSFLPLAHIFERMVMSFYLAQGTSIYFADDVKNVPNLLKELNPTLMTLVPRLLEKIDLAMHQKALDGSFIKKLIALMALGLIKKEINKKSFIFKIFDKLVYSKFRQAFGTNMRMLICGGAPLAYKNELFFKNIGMEIYQGYGLTETSPVICANAPGDKKDTTCGLKFDSVEVKITAENELVVRGDSVFKHYHKIQESPLDDDGWFHTGDLAHIDDDGYISIDGRLKELFKTSNAKFVSAIAIEQSLTQNRWIDYATIVADNKTFVSALLFLDPIFLENYASRYNLSHLEYKDLIKHKKVAKHISKIVHITNKNLNSWERIKKYELIEDIPSIESGILTPSMKVSRAAVYEKYDDIIKTIYGDLS
mgnify:CR=1 FL=1